MDEKVKKMCEMILAQYGEKDTWGKMALHCLGIKKLALSRMSAEKIQSMIQEGMFLFKGTSVMQDLQTELERRNSTTKVKPKAELNREVCNAIAKDTWATLKSVCGRSLMYAWGMFKPFAFAMVGDNGYYRYGIKVQVNGGHFKGQIAIVLDEGKDLYEVITFKRNGEVKEKKTDIYADCLKTTLNVLIEDNPNF